MATSNQYQDLVHQIDQAYRRDYQAITSFVSRRFGLDQGTAEDVVQDTFILALTKLETFDAERGNVKSWVYGIARHTALAYCNKKRPGALKEKLCEDEEFRTLSESDGSFGEEVEGLDLERCIKEDASKFDKQTQRIFGLWIEGHSIQEIGKRTGLTRYKVTETLEQQWARWRKLYQ